ncbi:MAG: HSP20 family protein [Limisphaerales bacterium]|jgi:HSP20 family protein
MPKSASDTNFASRGKASTDGGVWSPNTDVYETTDHLVIKVELAGINKEDLDLTVAENRMTVSGFRHDEKRAAKSVFRVMEIDHGPFLTAIDLPEGYDTDAAKASYQDGFLRIEVPTLK